MDLLPLRLIEASWALFILAWIAMAFFAKADIVKQRTTERESYSVAFIASLAFTILPMRGPLLPEDAGAAIFFAPLFPTGPALQWASAGFAMAGAALAIWARVTLGRDWSGMVAIKADHRLVTSGPYAAIRHPIYTAMLMLILGAVLWARASFSFIGLALMILSCWIKLRAEEEMMLEHLPDAYAAYMARTKRLVPWLV